jgi:hypothetical protein
MKFLCRLALILFVSTITASADATATTDLNSIGITFDPEPVENGLTFDRNHVESAPVTLHGTTVNAWAARSGSEPSSQNLRTFRFKVTEPRFQNGAMPVADVEFTYYAPGLMGVEFKADTARGSQNIGNGRGRGTDVVTVKFPLQDAFFGGRKLPVEGKPALNGFDLLMSTHNGDLYLRSVRIIGFDRQNNVDWSHMLRIDQVTSSTISPCPLVSKAGRSAPTRRGSIFIWTTPPPLPS